MLLAVSTTLLVGGLSAAGMIGLGFPATGSLGFGAAWAITGLIMIGVTAAACQLTSSARGAAGWALGTLGVLFVLRAVGDTATSDAAWLTASTTATGVSYSAPAWDGAARTAIITVSSTTSGRTSYPTVPPSSKKPARRDSPLSTVP